MPDTIDEYFDKLEEWLGMEAEAEAARMAERRQRRSDANAEQSGETLLGLVVTDDEPGLGGRYEITLAKRSRTTRLPWNRLRPGSPIVLSWGNSARQSCQGIVTLRSLDSISVSVNEWPGGDEYRIDLSADEVTRQRQLAALKVARSARETSAAGSSTKKRSYGRVAELRRVIIGERQPSFDERQQPADRPGEYSPPDHLNESQRRAIDFALSANDIAVIHGPPGTGKTTTVAELIRQAVAKGRYVLACAPSNTGTDNLMAKLLDHGLNAVRLGHPARVDPGLRASTLDACVARHEGMKLVKEMLREADGELRRSGRFTRAKPARGARQETRREAKQLKADARLLEQQIVSHVIDSAQVVCTTTTIDDKLLGDRHFDLVVIDEACQSIEAGCWIPMLRADQVILAGDHCQLPPTILSEQAARAGMAISLPERLIRLHGADVVSRRLEVQYRMHTDIMRFSSQQFYEDSLVADASVEAHLLHDLAHVTEGEMSQHPVTFIDTAGAGWFEEVEPDGLSKRNPSEADLVMKMVRQLCDAGLRPQEIAVIAPYAAQVRLLRELWDHESLEIDTVDGFQGREKEAVVISCVRSNEAGEIGFLADTRRMNVALTRARRKLIVIGDSATLGGNEFFAAMLEHFESIGAYQSVWNLSPEP